MGGGSTNFDAVGLEKLTNIALNEAFIKIATDAFRKTAGVDEKSPQGIYDASARSVGKTVCPGVACRKVNDDEAVSEPAGALAIAIADIHTDGVEFVTWPFQKLSTRTTLEVDHITNGWG
jgi:hypothetical protein